MNFAHVYNSLPLVVVVVVVEGVGARGGILLVHWGSKYSVPHPAIFCSHIVTGVLWYEGASNLFPVFCWLDQCLSLEKVTPLQRGHRQYMHYDISWMCWTTSKRRSTTLVQIIVCQWLQCSCCSRQLNPIFHASCQICVELAPSCFRWPDYMPYAMTSSCLYVFLQNNLSPCFMQP